MHDGSSQGWNSCCWLQAEVAELGRRQQAWEVEAQRQQQLLKTAQERQGKGTGQGGRNALVISREVAGQEAQVGLIPCFTKGRERI